MTNIRLQRRQWSIDLSRPLGDPGGFGAVYEGRGEDRSVVAIKKLNIDAAQAAHREIRIADKLFDRDFDHVIPVFDAGLDAESDSYFIVMAGAEHSLQDYIVDAGSLPERDSVSILSEIAAGLSEVSDLVHRDLKPSNVLRHEGRWKIADFGIARFVEEATSSNTLRDCLTPAFGAPEQWRIQRCTNATDIYALACIAHCLIRGRPPYEGPTQSDFREQHLLKEPPQLGATSQMLESLVTMMLRKAPESRPSMARVIAQLGRVAEKDPAPTDSNAEGQLQHAAAALARQKADAEAQESRFNEEQFRRQSIADEAHRILEGIITRLFSAIENVVVDVAISSSHRSPTLQAGLATLTISYFTAPGALPKNMFPLSGWDVISGATIQLTQPRPAYAWGSSLWYVKHPGGSYRWTEVGYMKSPLIPNHDLAEPFPLRDFALADKAAGPALTEYQYALGPTLIDDEDEKRFQDRWMELFAKAMTGELQRPTRLPVAL